MTVVAYNDLCCKEPHKQVDVGRLVASGSLGGVMAITLTRNVRDLSSIPGLDALFLIFITSMTIPMSH